MYEKRKGGVHGIVPLILTIFFSARSVGLLSSSSFGSNYLQSQFQSLFLVLCSVVHSVHFGVVSVPHLPFSLPSPAAFVDPRHLEAKEGQEGVLPHPEVLPEVYQPGRRSALGHGRRLGRLPSSSVYSTNRDDQHRHHHLADRQNLPTKISVAYPGNRRCEPWKSIYCSPVSNYAVVASLAASSAGWTVSTIFNGETEATETHDFFWRRTSQRSTNGY